MDPGIYDLENIDYQWCPGCGNYKILKALKGTLVELKLAPTEVVIVSGIGQAAKTPHFMNGNFFNGLHGRALSNATGIKTANRELTVIAIGGDGDMYGEGGNHFVHTIRRNPDITNIVCNNMVYGLTKGQASPTSLPGFRTPVQVEGVILEPFNPIAVAIVQGASFVARAFAGDVERTKQMIGAAIRHKGYALVDIFQPCIAFNKVNTYGWFRKKIRYVDELHDPHDRMAALALALERDKLPVGTIYLSEGRAPFEENQSAYRDDDRPLFLRRNSRPKLEELLNSMR